VLSVVLSCVRTRTWTWRREYNSTRVTRWTCAAFSRSSAAERVLRFSCVSASD
jgi:hypothetical protein